MTWHQIIELGCDPGWIEEDDGVFDRLHLFFCWYFYRISPQFFLNEARAEAIERWWLDMESQLADPVEQGRLL